MRSSTWGLWELSLFQCIMVLFFTTKIKASLSEIRKLHLPVLVPIPEMAEHGKLPIPVHLVKNTKRKIEMHQKKSEKDKNSQERTCLMSLFRSAVFQGCVLCLKFHLLFFFSLVDTQSKAKCKNASAPVINNMQSPFHKMKMHSNKLTDFFLTFEESFFDNTFQENMNEMSKSYNLNSSVLTAKKKCHIIYIAWQWRSTLHCFLFFFTVTVHTLSCF